jgi:hypothetical protein
VSGTIKESGISEWAWEVNRAGAHSRAIRAAALDAAGAAAERAGREARWHASRAAALRRGWIAEVPSCGERVVAGCGCGGIVAMERCGVTWACAACARRVYARTHARVRRAVGAIADAARARTRAAARGRGRVPPGQRWQTRMVTLTVRHSGSVAEDLRRLARAWARWRAWVRARAGAAPAYVRVVEVTPGADGAGHAHYHVIIALPFVNFGDARAAWARAVGQDDAQVDFGRASAVKAASYVAKYAAKGAMARGEWAPELAARVIDALYQRRKVVFSRGIGTVSRETCACEKCGEVPMHVPGRPTPAEYHAACAARAAAAERAGLTTCHTL